MDTYSIHTQAKYSVEKQEEKKNNNNKLNCTLDLLEKKRGNKKKTIVAHEENFSLFAKYSTRIDRVHHDC